MSFDARAAKQLAPGQNITSPDYPGLRLEASETKRAWIYRYRSLIDGKLRQIKIGNWPAVSLHAAVVEWEKLRALRDSGRDPTLEAKEERERLRPKKSKEEGPYTVRALFNDFLDQHVSVSRNRKAFNDCRSMFDRNVGDLADIPAADVTRAQAFDLINSYAARAPVIAGRLKSDLAAAWDHAIDSGKLPETAPNWWRRVLQKKIKSKGKKIDGKHVGTKDRCLSDAETGELIRWLPNFSGVSTADALTLYLWTATRGKEIVEIEGRDVALEKDGILWWTIPKAKTKNAKVDKATDLRVPLFGRAREIVERRKERYGDGYLFHSKFHGKTTQDAIRGNVAYHMPKCRFRPTLERPRLPVTDWSPHDLRRTARTMLAALGCPNEIGEAIIGHVLPGVAGVYNKYAYDKERVHWLTRLADHLESISAS